MQKEKGRRTAQEREGDGLKLGEGRRLQEKQQRRPRQQEAMDRAGRCTGQGNGQGGLHEEVAARGDGQNGEARGGGPEGEKRQQGQELMEKTDQMGGGQR